MRRQEKLNYFWIVEKKKLEDKRAELRNKEREMQDIEEKHQVEIKVRGRDGRTGDWVGGRVGSLRPSVRRPGSPPAPGVQATC